MMKTTAPQVATYSPEALQAWKTRMEAGAGGRPEDGDLGGTTYLARQRTRQSPCFSGPTGSAGFVPGARKTNFSRDLTKAAQAVDREKAGSRSKEKGGTGGQAEEGSRPPGQLRLSWRREIR